jgi:signal transduction histidine kinase
MSPSGTRLTRRDPASTRAQVRQLARAGRARRLRSRSVGPDNHNQRAQRAEHLIDNLPDACVLIVSRDGVVQSIRGEAQDLVGPADEVLGRSLAPLGDQAGLLRLPAEELQRLFADVRSQGRVETETTLGVHGRDVPVQVMLVEFVDGELLCLIRDLTEVKAIEQALLRRNDELRMAAERLQEVDTLKNEFMSNVSHELRTPLTAIIAYTEALLLTDPDPATLNDFLKVIVDQGRKLQRLIGGLLDIAKLESLATELKLARRCLNDTVRAAVVTVRPIADKSDIQIVLDLAPDLPLVYLDDLRSQQIVWNLLTNALKFSPPSTTVIVRTWFADHAVWASVRDQGIGIDPQHHALIFEKFVQVDGSTTRRHSGVGLGLDLVRHLVELHGGSVGVDSRPGEGATFTFSIPLEKRSRPRLGDPAHQTAETQNA